MAFTRSSPSRLRYLAAEVSDLELHGTAAVSLAVAYIAVGVFAHFHWFWGSHPRLYPFSGFGKLVSLVVFLPSFGYAVYRILSAFAV